MRISRVGGSMSMRARRFRIAAVAAAGGKPLIACSDREERAIS